MPASRFKKSAFRVAAILGTLYVILVTVVFFCQRSLLYFPSHGQHASRLSPWVESNRTIGYCRETQNPQAVWLMMHGNAGQAADRDYVLGHLSERDSLYVLEYPGYGAREGSPSRTAINQAASEAYRLLRTLHTTTPVCVLGESLGSGPACALALEAVPPDKIALVVPFDSLARVAARQYFFLPVRLLLHDAWDNVETLKHFKGPIDIFGAMDDTIIPIAHAKALAGKIGGAHFLAIKGGHNDWSQSSDVKLAR